MKTSLLGAGLVLLGVLAVATGPAAAFHGAAYTARGTALFALDGNTYDAVVRWSGAFGIGGGTYTIEITDPDTGLLIHKNSIGGQEQLTNVHFLDNCVEYVDYVGQGSVGVLNIIQVGGALGGDVMFRIAGWQLNNLCTGIANMHYEGHYLGLFDLVLDVWGPPGA